MEGARAAIVLIVATLAIGWRAWTPIHDAMRAFPWDAQWQYWGDLAFSIDALARRELPTWNPYDRCGYPFAADPQAGVLYPINWAIVAIGWVVGPKFWLVGLKTFFHVWWWALGTFTWLRRRGTPTAACHAGAIFCVLAFPANFWFSALNWSMAWTPWLLLAIDHWSERPAPKSAAWVALALAMAHLAGAPAAFWYALIVAVPYAAWAVLHGQPADADARRRRGRALATSAGVAFALFVTMVLGQTLATGELVPLTVRAARDLEFVAGGGLRAGDLPGLFVPRLPGHALYLGMVLVMSAAISLTVRPTARGYTLLGITMVGLLFSLGLHAPFLASFASFAPAAEMFRIAHRYMYVTIVPLAALGAEGLATLFALDGEARQRVDRWLVVTGGGAAVVFGVGIVTSQPAAREPYVWALFSWIFSAWVLRQLVVLDGRWKHGCLTIAAALLIADVWLARAPAIEESWWPLPSTPNDEAARRLPDVPLGARIFDREHFKYRAGARLQIRDFGGYEGDPLALRRYARMLDLAYQAPVTLGVANVAYVTGGRGPRPLELDARFERIEPDVARVPSFAPAVAWHERARIVDDEGAAFDALRALSSGALVLERNTLAGLDPIASESSTESATVAGRIVELGRGRLVAEIDAPRPGMVVIAEMFHPRWSATVDGNAARIVPANGAFRGVPVGAGRHRIEMTYRMGPPGWLMLLMPLGLVAALVIAKRRGREVAPAPSTET